MSVQLKAILAVLIVLPVALISCSATGKKVKKTKTAPLTPYQLRYATIDTPEGVTVIPDLSYEVNDDDKEIAMNVRIEEYDNDDIRPYFDKEIAELQYSNKIVDIVKQTSEDISGNKAAILRIEYKKYAELKFMHFVEYVGILCEKRYIVFKAWGFLDLFEPGEHLWQALYRSFRSDKSQPYKLPFGSFILPKEGVDYSRILLFFPNENDYTFTIEYANDIEEVKKHIPNFSQIVLSTFVGAKIKVKQDKTVELGSKKGRYFEAQVTTGGDTIAAAFFLVLENIKPGLEIDIGSNEVDTFERYRPQMEAMIQSIVFENDGFDVKTH